MLHKGTLTHPRSHDPTRTRAAAPPLHSAQRLAPPTAKLHTASPIPTGVSIQKHVQRLESKGIQLRIR